MTRVRLQEKQIMTPYRPWWTLKRFEEVQIYCKYYLYGPELKTAVCLVVAMMGTQLLVFIYSAWGSRRGCLFLI